MNGAKRAGSKCIRTSSVRDVVGIKEKTGLPVKLVGVGEQLEDLMDFDPVSYAEELFD